MFFRREAPRTRTFSGCLDDLRTAGFTVAPLAGGEASVTRGEVGTVLTEAAGSATRGAPSGLLINGKIATLADGGYQKFFRTPEGKTIPALAGQLKAIHDFDEDLSCALGLPGRYNTALGTVSTAYAYDRLTDRDAGALPRVWEEKSRR